MNEQTRSKLAQLKLFGILEGIESQERSSQAMEMPFEDRLMLLVDHEITFRENRRLHTLLRMARLKDRGRLEDLRYLPGRNIDRSLISNLSTCGWIHKGINVLVTGATGTGKTFLACAFGHQACLRGNTVQFYKISLLLDELEQAKIDGTLRKKLAFINRCALLILDDLGIKPQLSPVEAELLLEVLDGRCGSSATIMTSQFPLDAWHKYLCAADPTAGDALTDRLLTNAVRFELRGESQRQHKTPDLA